MEIEKQQIIEALQTRDEEWLFSAIKQLLEIDPLQPFSEEHRNIIEEHIAGFHKNPSQLITLDDLKEMFRNEGRLP